jgi:hypothetical protein
VASTKKIIKRALREQGLGDSQIERYGDTIQRAANALDAAPGQPARDVLTRAVGGNYDTRSYIDVVARAVEANRSSNGNGSAPVQDTPAPVDAPAKSAVTTVQPTIEGVAQMADRLREFARNAGLPSRQVEEALTYAGMTGVLRPTMSVVQDTMADDPGTPNEDQSKQDKDDALDLLTAAVQALRSALQ